MQKLNISIKPKIPIFDKYRVPVLYFLLFLYLLAVKYFTYFVHRNKYLKNFFCFQKNEKIFIQLLDIEYQKHPVDVTSALELFGKAIGCEDLSVHTKIKMSQRRLEFLEDFGSSIVQ